MNGELFKRCRDADPAWVRLGLPGAAVEPESAQPPCVGPDFEEAVLVALLCLSDEGGRFRDARVYWDCGELNGRCALYLVAVRGDFSPELFLIDAARFSGEVKAAHAKVVARRGSAGAADVARELLATPSAMARHDFGSPLEEVAHAD